MQFPYPSRKTTPAEYAVLVVFGAVFFIILGLIMVVVALRAAPEKHDLAVAVEYRGFWSLGIGLAIAAGYWLFRRFTNRC
jgi:hypothetical protein